MKKTLILFLSFLLVTLGTTSYSFTTNTIIHINLNKGNNTVYPRSINTHIYGIYNVIDNTIYLTFSEDIGKSEITVINESTGEMYIESAETKDGQTSIITSGTEGHYELQITTECGDIYEGEFTLQ